MTATVTGLWHSSNRHDNITRERELMLQDNDNNDGSQSLPSDT